MAKNSNNGKITAQNSFEGGLVADLHVMSSPSNTVRHALNMELVTIGEDQYIYQNIRGNKEITAIGPAYVQDNIEYPYTPLGLKVHNDIAYILAGAFKADGTFLAGMVGTFPSPDWDQLNSTDEDDPNAGQSFFEEVFRPLHNFKADGRLDSDPYMDPFVTSEFQFEKNRYVDIEIQGDFDGSVNIIFTDNLNNPSIINSRFKRLENNYIAFLADRANNNDSNTYSKDDWDRVSLIQNSNFPVRVSPGFPIVSAGGYLRGGGYRYYFKYATQEGNTTEVLYESHLIPISNGNLGLTKDQISDKKVVFELTDLDNSYAGIKVFFAHIDGVTEAVPDVFTISSLYTFNTNVQNSIVITHTGLEDIEAVDASEVNAPFVPLDTVRSTTIINDRLAMAGITSTLKEKDIETLSAAAKRVTLWERREELTTDYSDPNDAARRVGYWKGETYEFGIVFMLTHKGLSPVFPVTGMDNLDGEQFKTGPNFEYPADIEDILNEDGFSEDGLVYNQKGIFRTANSGLIYTPGANGIGIRHITYIEADTSLMSTGTEIEDLVSGFFIVRRERVKNVLMQGMMVPCMKLPGKPPTTTTYVNGANRAMDAAKRYLQSYFALDRPTIGLNSRYDAVRVLNESKRTIHSSCNVEFSTVFVPQVSQLINTLTYDKAWIMYGNIGQSIDDLGYERTITRSGALTEKMHMTFISAELDINFLNVQSQLNGVDPSIEMQTSIPYTSVTGKSPLMATIATPYSPDINFNFTDPDTYHLYVVEPVGYGTADWISINSKNITATLLESGTAVYSKNAFSAKVDRVLGWYAGSDNVEVDEDNVSSSKFGTPFLTFQDNDRFHTTSQLDFNATGSSARRVSSANGFFDEDADYYPYSIISQSYSSYLGIEVDVLKKDITPVGEIIELPKFYFDRYLITDLENLSPVPTEIIKPDILGTDALYVNTGHLANVFRSSGGRWSSDELIVLYKFDNGESYFPATDRIRLKDTTSIKIYRGDCFITKLTKKVAYKNGVPDAKSATPADAGTYGHGITGKVRHKDDDAKDLDDAHRYDLGRNLYDVGHTIELAAQTNVNADIRSIENVSDEETAIYGGVRNFFPNKREIFGDARPDAAAYNHGYTGDAHILSYSRIEENAPIFNTSFPNRILLSERNQTQSFFNSFRDLKGFNFRDYGVELGPIVKIIDIKNILLSVHPGGVLAIGVDDKTLVADGGDVYVDTAEALSPTAKTISNVYGSVHPESVIKTNLTIAGVDYNASAVWLFEGNKLSVISEFAVKTILESFKSKILALGGTPRVYSSFDFVKHVLLISYVSEDLATKEQIHVGSVTYNTALQRWSSEVSEGNKLCMTMGSRTFTTGFTQEDGNVDTIWEEDAKVIDGVQIRNNFRGVQYGYEFEFTINMQPSMEKILDSLLAITNKVLPTEIVYTTSNDNNDAAVNIWGQDNGEMVVTQKIVTRNKSTRSAARLGILEENAYYKNSDLYISVNKRGSMSRFSKNNKRIRDKHIKVKFVYTGSDETFLQAIISMLSISYS